VKFDVFGKTHWHDFETAMEFTIELLNTMDKASIVFTEIVASRAIVEERGKGALGHDLAMWEGKGPYTAEQFLAIMSFEPTISLHEWRAHMRTFN
jgi:formylmethanofuran dehydrogenase subunit A